MAGGSTEEGGVVQGHRFRFEHDQPEVAAIGGGLDRTWGGGQAEGGAKESLPEGVHLSSPPAEVDLPAIADQEGAGGDVLRARARTDHGAPDRSGEVRGEFLDELGTARVGVLAGGHRPGAVRLAHHIHLVGQVELHEVALVIGRSADVRARIERCSAGVVACDPAIHRSVEGAIVCGAGDRNVRAVRAAGHEDVASAVELNPVCRIGVRAAEVGGELQVGKPRIQAEDVPILVAATIGRHRRAGRCWNVQARRARGHHRTVQRIQRHFTAERIAVIPRRGRRVVHAVAVAAADVGGTDQRGGGTVEVGQHDVAARQVAVAVADAEDQRGAGAERVVVTTGRDGKIAGAAGAEHVQLIVVVHHQAMRCLVPGEATDVGAPHHAGAIGRPLAEAHVDRAAGECGLEHTKRDRVAEAEHDAATIQMPCGIVGGGAAEVVRSAAGVAGEGQYRVDHHHLLRRARYGEPDRVLRKAVVTGYRNVREARLRVAG